jgi:polygalacturonase
MLYTYGGNPAAVLTTATGDVVPNYPVLVRVAGTGALVTALYEADGTTPISELRTNPAGSDTPGAIRVFKAADVPAIEYEYNGPSGPVRWYEAGREVAVEALNAATDALTKGGGGTVTAPVTFAGGASVDAGLDVDGGATFDSLDVEGDATVSGVLDAAGGINLSGMRIFNPRVYGALGNGTANDAPAIQQALSAAAGAGGGWVIVPPGTYKLATLPLRIYRHTRLTLLPGATFVRATGATMLLNGDADQAYAGYSGHGDITIEGGVWAMQATAAGLTASRMCISLGHAENITIRGVEIRDVPGFHAIEVNACRHVRIEDSRFLGFVDPGGRDLSEAIQLDLMSEAGAFGGFGPYDATACEDIEIRGCYFGPSGTAGTTAWPRGVGSHNARISRWQRDIRILGNTFEGMIQYGVCGYSWEDVTISGNTMRGCGAGVRMRVVDTSNTNHTKLPNGTQTSASQPVRGIAITGNTITDCIGYDDSIMIEGEASGQVIGLTVTGNVLDGNIDIENGVRLVYASDYTISDNTILATDGSGISQQNGTGGVVGGNRINGMGGSGITANTCTQVKIADNNIAECGEVGVWLVGGSALTVEDNTITAVSRDANATSSAIRASSSASDVRIISNTVRRAASGNQMAYPLSITNSCSGIKRYGNDFDYGASGLLDDQSPNPELSPFDSTGALEELMRPAGRYETTSRLRASTASAIVSGSLYLVPIWLPKGVTVSNIVFVSSSTAAAGLTNHWFALFNSSRVALARTADATTAAWGTFTAKSLAIAQTTAGAATSYTTTYSGLHYLGIMAAGTTPPNLVAEGSAPAAVASVSPGFGITNTGMTTPPTVTGGAFTAAAPNGTGVQAYAYVT